MTRQSREVRPLLYRFINNRTSIRRLLRKMFSPPIYNRASRYQYLRRILSLPFHHWWQNWLGQSSPESFFRPLPWFRKRYSISIYVHHMQIFILINCSRQPLLRLKSISGSAIQLTPYLHILKQSLIDSLFLWRHISQLSNLLFLPLLHLHFKVIF